MENLKNSNTKSIKYMFLFLFFLAIYSCFGLINGEHLDKKDNPKINIIKTNLCIEKLKKELSNKYYDFEELEESSFFIKDLFLDNKKIPSNFTINKTDYNLKHLIMDGINQNSYTIFGKTHSGIPVNLTVINSLNQYTQKKSINVYYPNLHYIQKTVKDKILRVSIQNIKLKCLIYESKNCLIPFLIPNILPKCQIKTYLKIEDRILILKKYYKVGRTDIWVGTYPMIWPQRCISLILGYIHNYSKYPKIQNIIKLISIYMDKRVITDVVVKKLEKTNAILEAIKNKMAFEIDKHIAPNSEFIICKNQIDSYLIMERVREFNWQAANLFKNSMRIFVTLKKLHGHGLFHGDIKPSNLRSKLIDFAPGYYTPFYSLLYSFPWYIKFKYYDNDNKKYISDSLIVPVNLVYRDIISAARSIIIKTYSKLLIENIIDNNINYAKDLKMYDIVKKLNLHKKSPDLFAIFSKYNKNKIMIRNSDTLIWNTITSYFKNEIKKNLILEYLIKLGTPNNITKFLESQNESFKKIIKINGQKFFYFDDSYFDFKNQNQYSLFEKNIREIVDISSNKVLLKLQNLYYN